MEYFKNTATRERQRWWECLPAREQYLRTCLFRLKKWDIPEQKSLLSYQENQYDEPQKFIKKRIRLLKIAIQAVKRQLPVRPHGSRRGVHCGHCKAIIAVYMAYCPDCGHKIYWGYNRNGY